MRVTRANMQRLERSLQKLADLGLGEETIGFWLEHHRDGRDGETVREARAQIDTGLPMLKLVCQEIISILDAPSPATPEKEAPR